MRQSHNQTLSDDVRTMSHNQQIELIENIRQLLLQYEGVRLVIVYGSSVTELFREQSDIDIAVLFEEPLTPDQKMTLLGELASALRREIDLVDLYKLNGVLLKQILSKGVIVYKQSDHVLYKLLQRMIYNQSDFMPFYQREMKNRVEQFING